MKEYREKTTTAVTYMIKSQSEGKKEFKREMTSRAWRSVTQIGERAIKSVHPLRVAQP
jgi:hypothetical protein